MSNINGLLSIWPKALETLLRLLRVGFVSAPEEKKCQICSLYESLTWVSNVFFVGVKYVNYVLCMSSYYSCEICFKEKSNIYFVCVPDMGVKHVLCTSPLRGCVLDSIRCA